VLSPRISIPHNNIMKNLSIADNLRMRLKQTMRASGESLSSFSRTSGVCTPGLSHFRRGSGLSVQGLEKVADRLGLEIVLVDKTKETMEN